MLTIYFTSERQVKTSEQVLTCWSYHEVRLVSPAASESYICQINTFTGFTSQLRNSFLFLIVQCILLKEGWIHLVTMYHIVSLVSQVPLVGGVFCIRNFTVVWNHLIRYNIHMLYLGMNLLWKSKSSSYSWRSHFHLMRWAPVALSSVHVMAGEKKRS